MQCPVSEGRHRVSHTVMLPKEVPKGELLMIALHEFLMTLRAAKFSVEVRGYTVDEEDMLCLNLVVDFLPKFPHFW